MMHYRMSRPRMSRRAYRGRGEGIMSFLREKALPFIKKHQLVSRGAALLAPRAGSFAPLVTGIGTAANALGYGRRRRRGGSLRLSGGYRGGYRRVLA